MEDMVFVGSDSMVLIQCTPSQVRAYGSAKTFDSFKQASLPPPPPPPPIPNSGTTFGDRLKSIHYYERASLPPPLYVGVSLLSASSRLPLLQPSLPPPPPPPPVPDFGTTHDQLKSLHLHQRASLLPLLSPPPPPYVGNSLLPASLRLPPPPPPLPGFGTTHVHLYQRAPLLSPPPPPPPPYVGNPLLPAYPRLPPPPPPIPNSWTTHEDRLKSFCHHHQRAPLPPPPPPSPSSYLQIPLFLLSLPPPPPPPLVPDFGTRSGYQLKGSLSSDEVVTPSSFLPLSYNSDSSNSSIGSRIVRIIPFNVNKRTFVSASPCRCTIGCGYPTDHAFKWRFHEKIHELLVEHYLVRLNVLHIIAGRPSQNRWTWSTAITECLPDWFEYKESPGNLTFHGTNNSPSEILLQNDSCGKDSYPDQSTLRNDATRSSIISSCFGCLCRLIASCRPCKIAMFALIRQIPQALASEDDHSLSSTFNNNRSIFNQESPFDHIMSALMLIYLLVVWKIGVKAKAYALAFMLAMAVLWLPLIGDRSGVCKSVFKVWAATTFHYVVQDCVDATDSRLHVLKFLGLSMVFLIVGASLQQFAADSVLNVLPPSLALAAVVNWALPQPPQSRPGADEEAVYESIVGADNVDDRNYGAYQSTAGARLPQGSNINSTIRSIHRGSTIVPDNDPIELVPSIGDRSDADFVPGDDSATS
ncbi:hypothetical protein IQ07DRAFT_18497 [Pyrenochaeta sp. DS3sAY3a]|nr:hypothetical protein IQ07DRAFT_18497 [Pyrenochaeta sp. DS3sAY3a]